MEKLIPCDICLVIPAYNEEANLRPLLRELLSLGFSQSQIVVVDDGSTDRTSGVAKFFRVGLVTLPINLGIGGAVQTGWRWSISHGFSRAVQVDGDGQHPASEVLRLIELSESLDADLIIGSRFIEKGNEYRSTRLRRMGIQTIRSAIALVSHRWVSDPTSGLRIVRGKLLESFAKDYPSDYPEPESVAYALLNGFKVIEVPANMIPRSAGVSSIGLSQAIYYVLKVPMAIFIQLLRPRYLNES